MPNTPPETPMESDSAQDPAQDVSQNPENPEEEEDYAEADIVEVDDIEQMIDLDTVQTSPPPKFVFNGHSKQVFNVKILESPQIQDSSSGNTSNLENKVFFASGSEDDRGLIWDLSGNVVIDSKFGDSVTCLAQNAKGTLLAVGAMDGVVRVYRLVDRNPESPELLIFESDPLGDLECIDWHPTADILIAGMGDGQIWMWLIVEQLDKSTCQVVPTFGPGVTLAKFLPDGKRVIAGYKDGAARIWDMKSLQSVNLEQLDALVTELTIAQNGIAAIGSETGVIRLFGQDGRSLVTLNHSGSSGQGDDSSESDDSAKSVESLDFSENSTILAAGYLDGTVVIFDLSTGHTKQKLEHDESVVKCRFKSTFELISASLDGSVKLWDIRSGELLQNWEISGGDLMDFDFGNNLLAVAVGSGCFLFDF